jgi:hypothetical protein
MEYSILGHAVCRKTFLSFYNITDYEWKQCSSALKTSSTQRVLSFRVKTFKDTMVHDYTSLQTEQMYLQNVTVEVDGERQLVAGLPDQDTVVAAMTPISQIQGMAEVWLLDYFNRYAEHSPTRNLVELPLMKKLDIYKCYLQHNENKDSVTYQKFVEIWNAIFPR